jgi:hypothetical protein
MFFNIIAFKANNGYNYIEDNYFTRQQIRKNVFLFKMFVHGDGGGCDLVRADVAW